MEQASNIGFTPIEDYRASSGIGYIYIPKDINRDTYINNCYDSSKVSIMVEDSGIINNVYIDKHCLQNIEFPIDSYKLGTPVLYISEPIRKNCFIIGVFDKDITFLKEHYFNISKTYDDDLIDISGDAEEGFLTITVKKKSTSNFYLNVLSEINDANFKINVNGNFDIETSNFILKSDQEIILKSDDPNDLEKNSSLSITNESVSIDTQKFTINDGKERMILGDIFKKFFDLFIDEVSAITVSTPAGQMPIINKIQVNNFKEKTESFLSSISFLE